MQMLINIYKKSARDIWDESVYLIIFNLFFFLCTLPALLIFSLGLAQNLVLFIVAGFILLFPLPFVTFGLFYSAYDVGESKVISLLTFFRNIRQTWRPAAIWGVINLVAVILLVGNIIFYSRIQVDWANFARVAFVGLTIIWILLQLIILPLYPHLIEPGFRQAFRNAGAIFAYYPAPIIVLGLLTAAIIVITLRFQVLAVLFSFSLIAVLANNTVDAVVKTERGKANSN